MLCQPRSFTLEVCLTAAAFCYALCTLPIDDSHALQQIKVAVSGTALRKPAKGILNVAERCSIRCISSCRIQMHNLVVVIVIMLRTAVWHTHILQRGTAQTYYNVA